MGQPPRLGAAHIIEGDGRRHRLHILELAEGVEARDREGLGEPRPRRIGLRLMGRRIGAAPLIPGSDVNGRVGDDLRRIEPPEQRRQIGFRQAGGLELAGRDIEPGGAQHRGRRLTTAAARPLGLGERQQKIGLRRIQQRLLGQGSGRYDPHYRALERTLA